MGIKELRTRDAKRDIAAEIRRGMRAVRAASSKPVKLKRFDVAEHLRTPEECSAYLAAIVEEPGVDEKLIAAALGNIARAQGMMQVARDSGVTREALYRALSPDGNPSFATILKVSKALGLKLMWEAA